MIERYKPHPMLKYVDPYERIEYAISVDWLWSECEMVEDEEGEYVKIEDAVSWAMYWKDKYMKLLNKKRHN